MTQSEFGSMAVALLTYSLALVFLYSFVTEPALRSTAEGPDKAPAGSWSAAVLLGAFFALPGPLTVTADSDVVASVGAVAIALPGLMSHEAIRHLSVAQDLHSRAVKADGIWLCWSLGLFLSLDSQRTVTSPVLAIAIWSSGAWIAFLWIALQHKLPVGDIAAGWRWIRANMSTGGTLSLEGALSTLTAQFVATILAASLGLWAVGALRTVELAFGFVGLATSTVRLIGQPVAIRMSAAGSSITPFIAISAFLTAGIVVASALLWAVIPTSLAEPIVGNRLDEIREMLVPATIYMIAASIAGSSVLTLRGLGAVKTVVRLRLFTSVCIVAATLAVTLWRPQDPQRLLLTLASGHALAAFAWIAAATLWFRRADAEPTYVTSAGDHSHKSSN